MSWILGFVTLRPEGRKSDRPLRPEGRESYSASLSPERRERLASFGGPNLAEFEGGSHYIAAGGLPETCFAGELGDGSKWTAVGTAIRRTGETCRIFGSDDWKELLLQANPDLSRLGGGFIALRVRGDTVEVYSDPLGVRTFYWIRLPDGFLFSTRADWISALLGGVAIDYSAFGSHWLVSNQMGYRSLVRGIQRLPPAGHVQFSESDVHVRSVPWTPTPSLENPDQVLSAFLAPEGRRVSLGLSGGMDSRTLLAVRPVDLETHTFGPPSRADVQVASMLAGSTGVPWLHLDIPPSPADFGALARHAVAAQAVSPASSTFFLQFYRALHERNRVVVDGAFGEIMRRQFMNRLLRVGRAALERREGARILPLIGFDRGDFFAPDVREQMNQGAADDLQIMLDDLPLGLSAEEMVDLLAVRVRLPNFFGFEQARLDQEVLSYMPFTHPDVLDAVFSLGVAARRHGRYSRQIIARRDPRLRRIPLVKSGTAYPFWMSSTVATSYVLLRKCLSGEAESESAQVLRVLREPVLDRLHSDRIRTYAAYDYTRLVETVEEFYRTGRNAGKVDWWLAFDLWRESVESGSTPA